MILNLMTQAIPRDKICIKNSLKIHEQIKAPDWRHVTYFGNLVDDIYQDHSTM